MMFLIRFWSNLTQKDSVESAKYEITKISICTYIFFFTAHRGLFIHYYSVIWRPSDHTVGRPQAEIRTLEGRSRGRDSNHWVTTPPARPPHLLLTRTVLGRFFHGSGFYRIGSGFSADPNPDWGKKSSIRIRTINPDPKHWFRSSSVSNGGCHRVPIGGILLQFPPSDPNFWTACMTRASFYFWACAFSTHKAFFMGYR